MKYIYKFNNLDCPNCANKIECKLNTHNDINKANVNFSKLTVTIDSKIDSEKTKEIIRNVAKEIDANIKVLELNESNNHKTFKIDIIRLIIGLFLALIGIFIFKNALSKFLIILSYIILLFRTTTKAIKLITKKMIDENLLVTISCIGAYFTNNIHEGLMVIILYEIGKILESIAVNNSRKSISDLMNIKPEYVNLLKDNSFILVNPDEVSIGDIILIKQGEKIPLDGVVVKGSAKLNTSSLTGESKLLNINVGDNVLSGTINASGLIEVKVTSTYNDSTVSRIVSLVETATDRKAKTETFVTKVAKIYTPTILILAILVTILLPLFTKLTFSESLYRALVFLVVSCPCGIVISVPLSYFSGIGKSSKEGILIKGSDYLDALGNIKEIIFDKTGTITKGNSTDYKLEILDKSFKKEDIIKYYVYGERLSNHPIAKSIINLFNIKDKKNIDNFKEITGMGIEYKLNNQDIKIGSSEFCQSIDIDNAIYLNIDNKNIAKLILFDGIKKEVKDTINKLHNFGIKTKMFTGDNKEEAMLIGKKIGIDEVEYELLPEDKYHLLEDALKNENKPIAFVGDGINDAPSLALASIGISMGSIGSASAIEASDVVIINDELDKIITGINISKYTTKIIKQNLIFAIGTKLLVLILSILGIASMWQAVFADTGVTLLTIINTTRILKKKF